MAPPDDRSRPDAEPGRIVVWHAEPVATDPAWEDAYAAFETPEQEIRKFQARLRALGIDQLPGETRFVELFCGRGNGLVALERLGFHALEGVDLSEALLRRYEGPATLYAGDCRSLRFPDASRDVVVVQGGLHHLLRLPDDLRQVLGEVHRILVPHGRVVIVEPWLTPFLRVVHAACGVRLLRRLWPKLDALARMIELERSTYAAWLAQPGIICELLREYFSVEVQRVGWGKMMFVGRKD